MEYFKRYTGPESVSIVNALVAIGENSSYDNRKLIAAANGIADYSGTATQNLLLLSLLKDGKLIKPGTDAPAQPENTAEPTKQGFGRKVLIGALVLVAGIAAYKMFGGNEPTKTATQKQTKKKTAKKGRKGLKGIENDEQRAINYLKANYHGKHAEDIEEYVGNNWDWDKTDQDNLESFEAWLDNDNVLFLQDRFSDNSDEIDEFIDAEWDDTKSRYVNLKVFKAWLDDRNHNYNEGGDLFEVSGINDGKGKVKPLYNVDDYYGDDYVFAEQWLKEKLAADGLKIDKFWINEADECWEFIAKNKGLNGATAGRTPRVKTLSVADGKKFNISQYANISVTGNVTGWRKKLGKYGKTALMVRCGSYIYNVDSAPEIYDAAH